MRWLSLVPSAARASLDLWQPTRFHATRGVAMWNLARPTTPLTVHPSNQPLVWQNVWHTPAVRVENPIRERVQSRTRLAFCAVPKDGDFGSLREQLQPAYLALLPSEYRIGRSILHPNDRGRRTSPKLDRQNQATVRLGIAGY